MLGDKEFSYETANEVVTISNEEAELKAKAELSKRQRRFNNNVEHKSQIAVTGGTTIHYETKSKEEQEFELLDSIAEYYCLYDQPNDPQYTASARQSKGGSARSSDEA